MSQLFWEKSQAWRWLVMKTRDSKPFFYTFAAVCGLIPGAIGYGVMTATNTRTQKLESELRKKSRPDTEMMGRINRERIGEFLGELQRKEETNDRYVAALKGETLTRHPYVRIQPMPKQSSTEAEKEEHQKHLLDLDCKIYLLAFCSRCKSRLYLTVQNRLIDLFKINSPVLDFAEHQWLICRVC